MLIPQAWAFFCKGNTPVITSSALQLDELRTKMDTSVVAELERQNRDWELRCALIFLEEDRHNARVRIASEQ